MRVGVTGETFDEGVALACFPRHGKAFSVMVLVYFGSRSGSDSLFGLLSIYESSWESGNGRKGEGGTWVFDRLTNGKSLT